MIDWEDKEPVTRRQSISNILEFSVLALVVILGAAIMVSQMLS